MELQGNKKMDDMIKNSDDITMDTASLMEVERLALMVDKYGEQFIKHKKSITIPSAVFQELVRLCESTKIEKREKAEKALDLIRNNTDLFTIEYTEYTNDDIRKAFADRELLIRLSSARIDKKQLLITNDRKLSRDAYNLNSLESCSGKRVSVCYLSFYGDLCKCDCCVKTQDELEYKEAYIKKEPVYIEVEKKQNSTFGKICGYVILGTVIYGTGYGTCKYGKYIMNIFRNVM